MDVYFYLALLEDSIFQKNASATGFTFGQDDQTTCPTNFHQRDEMKNMIEGQVGTEFIWLCYCEHCILKIAFV